MFKVVMVREIKSRRETEDEIEQHLATCELTKGIKHATFIRRLELPFAPFVGLSIDLDEAITKVRWIIDESEFFCYHEPIYPHSKGRYQYSYKWLVENQDSPGGWILDNEFES